MARVVTLNKSSSQHDTPAMRPGPDYIADNLRKLYGAIEAEPLPGRLESLLATLADCETDKDGKT